MIKVEFITADEIIVKFSHKWEINIGRIIGEGSKLTGEYNIFREENRLPSPCENWSLFSSF